ncbi:MAG: hypothetical protein E4H14_16330 [Candidatus Thorarchaeota archaeon]|nr:MAG: hypothetical protein E4H14_16330 [Candidatus Thorarchaeota archaeon]
MDKDVERQNDRFPRTRFMGSKQRLLEFIWTNVEKVPAERVLDAFSGSSCVAYFLKSMGKEVHTNDFMKYSYMLAKATIENNNIRLDEEDMNLLFSKNSKFPSFINDTFGELYFSKEENKFLDRTYANIQLLDNEYKQAIALSALARACVKKRARGIFTFTGNRYDDGRKDLRKSMKEQFIESTDAFNNAIFDNERNNKSFNCEIFDIPSAGYDLVYIDPPYFSLRSDNDYSRRYHFVEGLMSYWTHVSINHNTKTKKFDKFVTPFDSKSTVYDAFYRLFRKFRKSTLVVSYSSNSLPTLEEMRLLMRMHKSKVTIAEANHRYSFGTQRENLEYNLAKEYLFIGSD